MIAALDPTIANLTSLVQAFRRKRLAQGVCLKNHILRPKVRPDICPDGYEYDGVADCKKTSRTGSMAQKAGCDESAMPMGKWCYLECPQGYPHDDGSEKCQQSCPADKPVKDEANLYCAESTMTLKIARSWTEATSASHVWSVFDIRKALNADGLPSSLLQRTVQSFANAGKGIFYARCGTKTS